MLTVKILNVLGVVEVKTWKPKFRKHISELKFENWKLKSEKWKLKTENRNLRNGLLFRPSKSKAWKFFLQSSPRRRPGRGRGKKRCSWTKSNLFFGFPVFGSGFHWDLTILIPHSHFPHPTPIISGKGKRKRDRLERNSTHKCLTNLLGSLNMRAANLVGLIDDVVSKI